MKKPSLPPRKIEVNFGDNKYEISFPTNGQLIDIESKKIVLSQDTHRSMLFVGTTMAEKAYLTIAAIATYSVLIPSLAKDLRVKSLTELTPMDSKDLLRSFIKEFSPWYNAWFEAINAPEEELDLEEDTTQDDKGDKDQEGNGVE